MCAEMKDGGGILAGGGTIGSGKASLEDAGGAVAGGGAEGTDDAGGAREFGDVLDRYRGRRCCRLGGCYIELTTSVLFERATAWPNRSFVCEWCHIQVRNTDGGLTAPSTESNG